MADWGNAHSVGGGEVHTPCTLPLDPSLKVEIKLEGEILIKNSY